VRVQTTAEEVVALARADAEADGRAAGEPETSADVVPTPSGSYAIETSSGSLSQSAADGGDAEQGTLPVENLRPAADVSGRALLVDQVVLQSQFGAASESAQSQLSLIDRSGATNRSALANAARVAADICRCGVRGARWDG
jgi:hypothetical protein